MEGPDGEGVFPRDSLSEKSDSSKLDKCARIGMQ